MAPDRARRYPLDMLHHLLGSSVAIWLSMLASLTGAGIAIFSGIWRAKHPRPPGFDFIASAQRIRARPIMARGSAEES